MFNSNMRKATLVLLLSSVRETDMHNKKKSKMRKQGEQPIIAIKEKGVQFTLHIQETAEEIALGIAGCSSKVYTQTH